MDAKCTNFKALLDWQMIQLKKHIKDNQYYLGQKFNHSFTNEEAEHDFFEMYAQKVCSDLRKEFCTQRCEVPACPLRDLFKEKEG